MFQRCLIQFQIHYLSTYGEESAAMGTVGHAQSSEQVTAQAGMPREHTSGQGLGYVWRCKINKRFLCFHSVRVFGVRVDSNR